MSSLLTIYQNSSTDNEIEESIPITSSKGQSTLEEIYQNNDIQLKILQVIKISCIMKLLKTKRSFRLFFVKFYFTKGKLWIGR